MNILFIQTNTKARPLKMPPKGYRESGIQIYCTKCRRWVTNALEECKHPENQQYKTVVYIPGSDNKTKSTVLKTRDYNEAVMMIRSIRERLIANDYSGEIIDNSKPDLGLKVNMGYYIDYLNKEGVYARLSGKKRSKTYIELVKLIYKNLIKSLKNQGYDHNSFTVCQLNKAIINKYLEEIEKQDYSASYNNKHISYMRTFYEFLINVVGIDLRNPFKGYQLAQTYENPSAIKQDEFYHMLDLLNPENGRITYGSKKVNGGVKRNLYRPWLADGFKLCLFSGRRQEEVVNFKFSDIKVDKNGVPIIIRCRDLKVERIMNKERPLIPVPIGPVFRQLIYDLGWGKYKNTDVYLFGNDSNLNRQSIQKIMSKAFSHYFKQLNTGKNLTLKSLRKTFVTAADIYTNGNAGIFTGQSNNIINKSYLDKEAKAENAAYDGFDVFKNDQIIDQNIDQNIDHSEKCHKKSPTKFVRL